MFSTFELGRGVLHSSNFKVDLVTSVTVSAKQGLSDCHQVSEADFRHLIRSGNFNHRGENQFCLSLTLELDGEPLPDNDRDNLTSRFISAPAWEQLQLQPSIYEENNPQTTSFVEPGTIQLMLNRITRGPAKSDNPFDRIGSETDVSSLRSRNNFMQLKLHRVHFSLSVTGAERQRRNKKRRRAKPLVSDPISILPDDDLLLSRADLPSLPFLSDEEDDILQEKISDYPDWIAEPQDLSLEIPIPGTNILKRHVDALETSPITVTVPSINDREVLSLVEASIRLSVYPAPYKLSSGMKILRNDFVRRLAEVFPIVWNPNRHAAYLQRTLFLPILGRSLTRCAHLNTRSSSLKAKVETLHKSMECSEENVGTNGTIPSMVDNLECRISLYAQKKVKTKNTARLLEPFIRLGDLGEPTDIPDEILEDCPNAAKTMHRSESWLVEDELRDLPHVDDEDEDIFMGLHNFSDVGQSRFMEETWEDGC